MNRDIWLANRKNHIGSSEVAAILGQDPYRSASSIWASKVHGEPTDYDNDQMAFGRDVESAIANLYTRRTGIALSGYDNIIVDYHPYYPWIGATLDRWLGNPKIPHEIKNIGSWDWNEKYQTWEDDPPLHHVIQVQTQCACTGSDHGYLIGMFPGYRLVVARIDFSQEFWEAALPKLIEFWESVQNREPPEPTVSKDLDAMKRIYRPEDDTQIELDDALAEGFDRFDELKIEIKKLKDEKSLLEAKIRSAMGNASVGLLPDGRKAKIYTINRTGYTVQPSTHTQLRILKAGKRKEKRED